MSRYKSPAFHKRWLKVTAFVVGSFGPVFFLGSMIPTLEPARLTMDITDTPASLTARYTVDFGGKVHELRATGSKPATRPGPDSLEHFFKEHSWGYGRTRRGKLIRYEVNHPEWDVYPVTAHRIDVDWAALYGPAWGDMTGRAPDSVVLAAGSEIAVFPKGTA